VQNAYAYFVTSFFFICTDWDPVGVFCSTEAKPYIRFDNEHDYSTLSHELNFRSKLKFVIDFLHLSDESFAYM